MKFNIRRAVGKYAAILLNPEQLHRYFLKFLHTFKEHLF